MCEAGPTNSTNEDIEVALLFSINIKERSSAMIDVVHAPNNTNVITLNKNDTSWLKETSSVDTIRFRYTKIVPGYYTVLTLRAAIEVTLNSDTKLLFGIAVFWVR